MMKMLQQNNKKIRKLLWGSIMFCLALIIAAWHQPTRKDFIAFSILSICAAIFFGLFSKQMQKTSFLFERILFYGVVTAGMSIIIPVVDAAVMAGAAFLCELDDRFKKQNRESTSD